VAIVSAVANRLRRETVAPTKRNAAHATDVNKFLLSRKELTIMVQKVTQYMW
jgi:hypothetical protein